MGEYQVISRKYRPQKFSDVFGQDPIVQTLKNAIKQSKLAHAYLFSGSRGTGKTTLARLFAKAINCPHLTPDFEPCCQCQTCKEIAMGTSLDVLEIDGASNRGIDDIRKIKDNVGYRAATTRYKIYIIDEVHMLTKEAFNALLKTLEEPPANVKFIFATTELHKVLPTIISRCQRFSLSRISTGKIKEKLKAIAEDLGQNISDDALGIIAKRAEGGLRDAESLLEQIISFHEGPIDKNTVADILGIMPEEALFEFDLAGKEGRFVKAFEIVHALFSEGKDFQHFIEMLTEHYRNLLLLKLGSDSFALLELQPNLESAYASAASLYTKEQLLDILDYLFNAQSTIREAPSCKVALEALLLRIMRTHRALPIELLVKRLIELEQNIGPKSTSPAASVQAPAVQSAPKIETAPVQASVIPSVPIAEAPVIQSTPKVETTKLHTPVIQSVQKATPPKADPVQLGFLEENKIEPVKIIESPVEKRISTEEVKIAPTLPQAPNNAKDAHFYDTMLQFATIELEGRLKRSQQFNDPKK